MNLASIYLLLIQVAIERGVMERVYKLAMFPNGDGDTQRDKIYSDSVARLAANVTPNHRLVLITVLVAYPTSYFSIS